MNIFAINRIIVFLVIIGSVPIAMAQNPGTTVTTTITPHLWFDASSTASLVLDPDPGGSPVTTTSSLEVRANKAGWSIAVQSDDTQGRAKSGATRLFSPLGLSATPITGGSVNTITPPLTTTSQPLLTGTAHTQGPQTSTITYSQMPNWADDAALTYQIVITFVGTPP